MPQMGESIAEGTLSKWLKKVGDAVKRDEPLFEKANHAERDRYFRRGCSIRSTSTTRRSQTFVCVGPVLISEPFFSKNV